MNRYFWTVGMMGLVLLIAPGSANAADSFFDVFTELTAGPPYPTDPVEVMVSRKRGEMPLENSIETEIIGVGLLATDNNSPAKIVAYDSGGGGGAGIASFFDVFTAIPDDYPADSFFDLFVEISPPDIDTASPVLVEPPHGMYADSFFDVFVEVDIPDLGGYERLHLHGEIGPGQPLSFADVHIPSAGDSFFDVFVTLDKSSPIIFGSPLMTMTMTGTFVPEPATLWLLLTGGLVCLGKRGEFGTSVGIASKRGRQLMKTDT